MTSEEKRLLLKDLCTRLPYGVRMNVIRSNVTEIATYINSLNEEIWVNDAGAYIDIEEVRPYLRPMSSMTEEEKAEMSEGSKLAFLPAFEGKEGYCTDTMAYCAFNIDFCLKHHLDYRGLIEKGLALEAPEGMYK